jgi:hypothetical protein
MARTLDLDFHHLGLAVANPEAARQMLGALGYELSSPLHDPLQNVNLQMCEHASMPDIELIWPESGKASPIDNMLKKRDGLVYHICYIANDASGALAAIEKMGLRVLPLGEPKPAVLFNGKLVSFYHVHGVGMIEIIHNR